MPKDKTFQNYLSITFNYNFLFHNIDEKEVGQIINDLPPKTSFGFD